RPDLALAGRGMVGIWHDGWRFGLPGAGLCMLYLTAWRALCLCGGSQSLALCARLRGAPDAAGRGPGVGHGAGLDSSLWANQPVAPKFRIYPDRSCPFYAAFY